MKKKPRLIAINILKGFAGPVFNFAIAVIGIKYFGKAAWGTWVNLMLWIALFIFISNWGNREFLLRKYSRQGNQIYALFFKNYWTRNILLLPSLFLFFFFPLPIAVFAILLAFLIHTYTSLDSLVVYHQQFGAQLVAELFGFLLIIGGIYTYAVFDLLFILQLFCSAFLLKTICLIIALKLYQEKLIIDFSFEELQTGFPFFLIGFSGWLQSKIDLYIVSAFLTKSQLSDYQLIITAFLMLKSVPAQMILPFSKHIFRLGFGKIQNMKHLLVTVALPITAFGTFGIYIIFEKIIILDLDPMVYFLGGLSCLPYFFYVLDIMEFYKKKEERQVMKINFLGAFLYLGFILIFIKKFQIHGVLLGIIIAQGLILLMYKKGRTKSHFNNK
jgi:O-antigen/teichoic acid export membrane protein